MTTAPPPSVPVEGAPAAALDEVSVPTGGEVTGAPDTSTALPGTEPAHPAEPNATQHTMTTRTVDTKGVSLWCGSRDVHARRPRVRCRREPGRVVRAKRVSGLQASAHASSLIQLDDVLVLRANGAEQLDMKAGRGALGEGDRPLA